MHTGTTKAVGATPPPQMIDVAEVAHHMRCHPKTIRRHVARGVLPEPDYRSGSRRGRMLWLRTRFLAWLESQRGEKGGAA